MFKYPILLSVAVLLCSCSVNRQVMPLLGGQVEHYLGEGKYLIGYQGSFTNSNLEVQARALKRAKEICTVNEYDDFEVVLPNAGNENTTVGSSIPFLAAVSLNRPSASYIIKCVYKEPSEVEPMVIYTSPFSGLLKRRQLRFMKSFMKASGRR